MTEKVFYAADIGKFDDLTNALYRFMFEDWYPGASEIRIENICCAHCGYIGLFPSVSEHLINERRYRGDSVQVGFCPVTNIAISKKRSKILYDYLKCHIDLVNVDTVLDFGGMDGNLMQAFIDRGKKCSLIDYCTFCIEGVTKLGNTVADLKPDAQFDLIVCSHIIEHVVSPVDILNRLSQHLSNTGILYVEVPMELWKRPPLLKQKQPISHLSFFSPGSLKNLLVRSGLSVMECELFEYLHTNGRWNSGIRSLGGVGENVKVDDLTKQDATNFLNPGFWDYMRFYYRNPRRLKRELLKRVPIKKPPFKKAAVSHKNSSSSDV